MGIIESSLCLPSILGLASFVLSSKKMPISNYRWTLVLASCLCLVIRIHGFLPVLVEMPLICFMYTDCPFESLLYCILDTFIHQASNLVLDSANLFLTCLRTKLR